MECLGKVLFFAILPGYLCNDTWMCRSHWSFQSSARIWVQRCSVNAHFPLAVSKTLGISKKPRNFQEGLAVSTAQATCAAGAAKNIREQDSVCLHQDYTRNLQSKTKAQRSQGLLVGGTTDPEPWSRRQRGRDAEWPLAGEIPSALKDRVLCIIQTWKGSGVWKSSWKTGSSCSVPCLDSESPWVPQLPQGPAEGQGPSCARGHSCFWGSGEALDTDWRGWRSSGNVFSSVKTPLKTYSFHKYLLIEIPSTGNSSLLRQHFFVLHSEESCLKIHPLAPVRHFSCSEGSLLLALG